jgi:thioredoxin-like negative regulator of GroEL
MLTRCYLIHVCTYVLRMLKVDSDAEPRIASALKVYGLPTIFFMKVGTHG